jgi:hypothetical protein
MWLAEYEGNCVSRIGFDSRRGFHVAARHAVPARLGCTAAAVAIR